METFGIRTPRSGVLVVEKWIMNHAKRFSDRFVYVLSLGPIIPLYD